ncbi:hypothetical protein [Streptomyces arboris]|uniref:hypothetical protein n=1 Tax=Streptomyces arboris TaxID=2600619 RepID=UPI00363B0B0B
MSARRLQPARDNGACPLRYRRKTLSFAAHLLAWDLAQLRAPERITPVVLLDSFEEVGSRTVRDFERLLQRIVYLMPNAFFVVTGRDRLQWADEGLQGQLDWTGRAAWPGLAAHVPGARTRGGPAVRQILVGDLSPDDCDDHLARRLRAPGGQPLMEPDLRRAITDRSHGLPLYLDLAVMRFLEIRRSGQVPQPDDFGDFPALISRTLSDLTTDERHVLRSVSLLDAFSVPLATHVAGLTHDAAALRLTEWLYRAVVTSLVDGFGRRPEPRSGDVDEFGRHRGSWQGSIGMLLVKGPGHAADVEGRAVRGDPA